jgi:AraC-like DNA-binding protein
VAQYNRAGCSSLTVCGDGQAKSTVTFTDQVRIEILKDRASGPVSWAKAENEIGLFYFRCNGGRAQIRMTDGVTNRLLAGRASFCFFPQGVRAEGKLEAEDLHDYTGVLVEPSVLPWQVRQLLSAPLIAFHHDALGRAFDELPRELGHRDEIVPLFTRAWVTQAVTYVARVANTPRSCGPVSAGGLAPWQLRRAEELLRANLAGEISLARLAAVCGLSVRHFTRGFKAATGVPPHQRLLALRVEAAREQLTNSSTPLAEVAGLCGFSDQSHFTRTFVRHVGVSPGAWRREHGGQAMARAA